MTPDAPHDQLLPDDLHDRVTAANTHPAGWRNPAPADRYDLVVVGGGTAGLVSAGVGSLLGARVALIERAYTGGDCLITGCVPSKALLRCARAAAEVRDAERFGLQAGDAMIDFAKAMDWVRSKRSQISRADAAHAFSDKYGVDVMFGNARFSAADTVQVDGVPLRFRKAIIATGSSPKVPDIPGLAKAGFYTNETIFNLTRRPDRLAIVGGGPLGCEMAQAFARLGSTVTLIERNDRFLPHEHRRAAEVLMQALRRDGVDVRAGTQVERVNRDGSTTHVHLRSAGKAESIDVDAVLIGIGRSPNVDGLGLDIAGVEHDEHGVTVNDFLRTTNPHIYAAGDICLKEKFTHTADASARLAVQNALLLRLKRWSRQVVPHVTYTEPELAQVGPVEPPTGSPGRKTYTVPMSEIDRAQTDGDEEGFLAVTVDQGNGRIISATCVGTRAGELIAMLTAAMTKGQRLAALADVIFPYPTHADTIKKAADAAVQDWLAGWKMRLVRRWVGRSRG
ncbi:MAG TPA: mercuric reductase [Tepidisphaeraceae bacterium]|jgi:pyruvate/2-oxoglutarate dehydrogenase complex dihydrolipoamide dehydrogenase (E3) component|nr:mercuric reductase [Tepidisphaeraceae bacterium]